MGSWPGGKKDGGSHWSEGACGDLRGWPEGQGQMEAEGAMQGRVGKRASLMHGGSLGFMQIRSQQV